MIAAAMAVVLAGGPLTILGILYQPGYAEGARALPVLAAAVCRSGAAVGLRVDHQRLGPAGRRGRAVAGPRWVPAGRRVGRLVPRAAPGPDMLLASAVANGAGVALGLASALHLPASPVSEPAPPLATRGCELGARRRRRRWCRAAWCPKPGKARAASSALAVVGVVFVAVLLLARELGPGGHRQTLRQDPASALARNPGRVPHQQSAGANGYFDVHARVGGAFRPQPAPRWPVAEACPTPRIDSSGSGPEPRHGQRRASRGGWPPSSAASLSAMATFASVRANAGAIPAPC